MSNVVAINSVNRIKDAENIMQKSVMRISSGYRINSASDDASGLAISEKMRSQIRSLNKALSNAEDGISYIQTGDSALNEVHSMLQRIRELSVQASNGVNTETERSSLQLEVDELMKEIDRVADTTEYNGKNIFSVGGVRPSLLGNQTEMINGVTITCEFIDEEGNIITNTGSQPNAINNYSGDMLTMAEYIQDETKKAVGAILGTYTAFDNASSSGIKIGLNLANIDGNGGTLASAKLKMKYSSVSTSMTYTLNVDTSDYDITNYNDGELSATIAHEMTHLIMYDCLTGGMLGENSEPYPDWFVEGMAQTASGDNGWFSNRLDESSSDADIKDYLSQVSSMEYGAGYLATVYLGQIASGNTAVTAENVKNGLNNVLDKLIEGYTLSQVINEVSGGKYTNYYDFQNNLYQDTDAIQFTKDFIVARGTTGTGSVISGDFSIAQKDVLSGANANASNYIVDQSANSYTNSYNSGFTFPDRGTAGSTSGSGNTGGNGGGTNTNNGESVWLQLGTKTNQGIYLHTYNISTNSIFKGRQVDFSSSSSAMDSISYIDDAINSISSVRSNFGAVQNRLEHTIFQLGNTSENIQIAESRLRDANIADEIIKYSTANIISQTAQAMLTQANQSAGRVVGLLKNSED